MKKHPIFVLVFIVGIALQFYSCSNKVTKSRINKPVVIYPSPPDTARIQFLTALNGSNDVTGKQSRFSKFVLGEPEPKSIDKPYGVAISDGKIFICDTGLGGLEIIDLEANTFEYFVPGGHGQLQVPLNCFVDEDGNLYVADGGRFQIVVFDQNMEYLTAFGEGGTFKPTDVFVYQNKIWVADMNNNRINVYDKATHKLLFNFPDADKTEESYLFMPTNLWLANDMVYVSDIGGFNVKIFNLEGKYQRTIGSHGDKLGQFARPKGIAASNDSTLYVVDAGFENVQMFDNDGNLLMFFGGPYKGPGDMWLPAKVSVTYKNLNYFKKYLDPAFDLKYLIFVSNQFGPDKINVYGAVTLKN